MSENTKYSIGYKPEYSIIEFQSTLTMYKEYSASFGDNNLELRLWLDNGIDKLEQIEFSYKRVHQIEFVISTNSMEFVLQKTEGAVQDLYIDAPNLGDIFQNLEDYKSLAIRSNGVLLKELRTYVEHLYYTAFNFCVICKQLPGLKNFKPAGVRDVRNHLLEHIDKKRLYSNDIVLSPTSGVLIRTMCYEMDSKSTDEPKLKNSTDNGVNQNFIEYKKKLENYLCLWLDEKSA